MTTLRNTHFLSCFVFHHLFDLQVSLTASRFPLVEAIFAGKVEFTKEEYKKQEKFTREQEKIKICDKEEKNQ